MGFTLAFNGLNKSKTRKIGRHRNYKKNKYKKIKAYWKSFKKNLLSKDAC